MAPGDNVTGRITIAEGKAAAQPAAEAPSYFEKGLLSEDSAVRIRALNLLEGRTDIPNKYYLILKATQDTNPKVRKRALEILAAITGPKAYVFLPVFIDALQDHSQAVRELAVTALTSMEYSYYLLVFYNAVLSNELLPPKIRDHILSAALGPVQFETVKKYTEAPSADIRLAAFKLISARRDQNDAPLFIVALADPDLEVAAFAEKVLLDLPPAPVMGFLLSEQTNPTSRQTKAKASTLLARMNNRALPLVSATPPLAPLPGASPLCRGEKAEDIQATFQSNPAFAANTVGVNFANENHPKLKQLAFPAYLSMALVKMYSPHRTQTDSMVLFQGCAYSFSRTEKALKDNYEHLGWLLSFTLKEKEAPQETTAILPPPPVPEAVPLQVQPPVRETPPPKESEGIRPVLPYAAGALALAALAAGGLAWQYNGDANGLLTQAKAEPYIDGAASKATEARRVKGRSNTVAIAAGTTATAAAGVFLWYLLTAPDKPNEQASSAEIIPSIEPNGGFAVDFSLRWSY